MRGALTSLFGGMTLKKGRQKAYFENLLRKTRSELAAEYSKIYRGDPWGNATAEY
jgi:hypothetical protein